MDLIEVFKHLLYEQNAAQFYFLLLSSLSCFIIALFVFNLTRKSKFNLPPSPPRLPIIGNLHQLGTLPHRSLQTLSQKYGPLMLLQLGHTPTLVVSSAEMAREMMKTNDLVFANRPQTRATKIFLYGCVDVAFALYGKYWRHSRKICTLELLSQKRVQSFHRIREEEVQEMIGKICESASFNNGFSMNLSEIMLATSNNIVCRCVLGQKYDSQDCPISFGELARKVLVDFTAFCVGDIFPSFGWIDILIGPIPRLKSTFGALDAFFDKVIQEHKQLKRDDGNFDNKDFVDFLLQLQEDRIPDFELTQNNIKAILMNMLLGGTDTTSTALEWAMTELIKNPTTMKKAQEEIRRVVGNKSKLNEDDINQMSYLKCVIKETLRLHPPGPLLLPREATFGAKLGGFDIPPKTTVLVNAWAIQRDATFWDYPEEFVPERFENNEVDFKGQDFQFIPFGGGRRVCPGIFFGVASLEYVLANVLYWFDWKLPRDCKSNQELDMSETYGITVTKKVPLYLEPTPLPFESNP